MIDVVFVHIFDAEVINDELKNDVFGGVFPKRGGARQGHIQTWIDADGGVHSQCAQIVSGGGIFR